MKIQYITQIRSKVLKVMYIFNGEMCTLRPSLSAGISTVPVRPLRKSLSNAFEDSTLSSSLCLVSSPQRDLSCKPERIHVQKSRAFINTKGDTSSLPLLDGVCVLHSSLYHLQRQSFQTSWVP